MLSQHEISASDTSAQTRHTRGVLTPLSDNYLNSNDGDLHGGKKRKRDASTIEDLLKDTFIVRVSRVASSPRQ